MEGQPKRDVGVVAPKRRRRRSEVQSSLAGASTTDVHLERSLVIGCAARRGRSKTRRAERVVSLEKGVYEFQVLPFGLTGAPGHCERIMDTLLAVLKWSECMVYLDDVIVYGKDIGEHNERLKNVLECVRGAGLSLKPSKCRFAYQKLPILGHVVSENSVEPATDKIEAVKEFPIPKDAKQVRSFLGLCGYYRRFIRNFSKISKPLTCLTEKDKKLTEEPILAHFNPEARIEIHTDASMRTKDVTRRRATDNGRKKTIKTFDKYVTDCILENERLKDMASKNYEDRTMMNKCHFDIKNREHF
ncbi:hypothetical protein LAZ67_5001844 [Cordylochernes scorpioides]|uniref:Reverse transcriptase domain-containing protein n=1 Tax=Cordylochernes scorpioides TaxID=51811 RepID=A0ABY6KFZ0_9ARAC|nr:hypothetical protein LAZ67_5001844 [Cordylochernes scorpioides]